MSEALGLEVVAEGVETTAHRAFLVEHGCQFCQGYLLGRPVPIAAWEAAHLNAPPRPADAPTSEPAATPAAPPAPPTP